MARVQRGRSPDPIHLGNPRCPYAQRRTQRAPRGDAVASGRAQRHLGHRHQGAVPRCTSRRCRVELRRGDPEGGAAVSQAPGHRRPLETRGRQDLYLQRRYHSDDSRAVSRQTAHPRDLAVAERGDLLRRDARLHRQKRRPRTGVCGLGRGLRARHPNRFDQGHLGARVRLAHIRALQTHPEPVPTNHGPVRNQDLELRRHRRTRARAADLHHRTARRRVHGCPPAQCRNGAFQRPRKLQGRGHGVRHARQPSGDRRRGERRSAPAIDRHPDDVRVRQLGARSPATDVALARQPPHAVRARRGLADLSRRRTRPSRRGRGRPTIHHGSGVAHVSPRNPDQRRPPCRGRDDVRGDPGASAIVRALHPRRRLTDPGCAGHLRGRYGARYGLPMGREVRRQRDGSGPRRQRALHPPACCRAATRHRNDHGRRHRRQGQPQPTGHLVAPRASRCPARRRVVRMPPNHVRSRAARWRSAPCSLHAPRLAEDPMSTIACLDERNARGSALARRLTALALLLCGQALATPENTDAQGAQSSEPPNTAPGPHRPSLAGAVITTDVDTLSAWVTLAVSNIDPDETYAYEVVGAPSQGGSVETAYPRLRYAPPDGFVGSSALQVRLCSTAGVCSEPATVTFEVKDLDGIPDIVGFAIRTAEDTPSERVLVTVSDSTPGDTHTLEQITDSPFGTLEIDGLALVFHPIGDFHGPTSVDVIACDAGGQCSVPFTVPIMVTAVDDPPAIPERIDLLAWENHPSEWLRVPASSVDGYSALALRVETPPATGTVEIDVDDPLSIRYVPNPGSTTDDTFRFTVCDPRPVCSPPATATLTLDARNSPPSASDIAITTDEDTASTWVAVPIQDANPGDRHRITITQASPDGTAEVSQTRIRFVPLQDFNGTAAFQFRVCDDKGACAPENLATVVVAPVADPPLAHPVMIHTQQDMASEIVEPAITDPDGRQTLTLEIIAQPRGGYAEISPLGIRFIPDPGFRGETTFDYRACDTAGLCSAPAPARVTVTRTNTTPLIAPISLELQEDAGTGLVAPLIHDPDPDEHHTLEVQTPPAFGRLVVEGAAFEYVPEQDWFGADSAVLRVCDSLEECSEVALALTVNPVNDPPVVSPMRIRTTEDTPSAPQTLAISDIDSISPPTVSVIQGSGGTASVISGEVIFTPDRDWAGATSFSIQVCDDAMACTTLDVPVLVEHINDPPSVSPFTIVIDEDTSSAPVTVEFSDPDGLDTHTLVISQDPLRGAAQVVAGQMQVVYRPQPDFHGSDGFSVEICDQLGVCSEAEVTVVVNPVNDAPVALDLAIITKQDEPSEWFVANVADPDEGDIHILRILSQPATALVELDPTRNALRAMPDPGATGIETFQIEVCDLAGACLDVDASVEIIRAQPFATQASSVVVPVVANTELESGREHVIQSAAIVLQDGSGRQVEGILGVRVALSADAPYAYVVRGVRIEPGQTVAIDSVDFTASAGRLAVPIRLAHLDGVASGFGGSLRFMLDDPYAPDVNTDITLWDPAESIHVSADKPAYARNVEPVVVSAAVRDEACPDGVFDYDRPQLLDSLASNRSYCAVRWTRLPPGLAQSTLRTAPFVEGYLESEPGPETLTYEVGLVSWNAEGQFVFMPAARAGRIDLSVFDPPPPEITFEPSESTSPGTAFLAQGRWRVNVGSGVMVGTIRAAADYPGLRLLIESPT
ncbi:MAG: tandem-95 repeat protein, partial [Gammaproteobacteria bacterium]|nr:tandem-95 repeat protein [Gammaproteobacteria bacterium]